MGRVGEDPREEFGVGVCVGVVECELHWMHGTADQRRKWYTRRNITTNNIHASLANKVLTY